MKKIRASDLKPDDLVCTVKPIGRAMITQIRPSATEIKSKAGKYGNALMVIYRCEGLDYSRCAIDSDFVHPDDYIQTP
jgi:hypothetical protein